MWRLLDSGEHGESCGLERPVVVPLLLQETDWLLALLGDGGWSLGERNFVWSSFLVFCSLLVCSVTEVGVDWGVRLCG